MPALAAVSSPIPSNGCRLVAVDGRTLPLLGVEVDARAGGGLATVRLRQTFRNPWPEPLATTYTLPLPADGAVVDFSFTLAGRVTKGRVARKADARQAFEQAMVEGRTAALLEQDRSSVFTQELGNLPPGAEVVVEIEVEQLLAWVSGGWEWRWPTVVGPRYLGTHETPDAERMTVSIADTATGVTCTTVLAIEDLLTGATASPSHGLSGTADRLGLEGPLDRDIVVRWPVAAPEPGVRLETARPAGHAVGYGVVTLVPPAMPGIAVPRDVCLLLDTSGSMSGRPLAQLKALSKAVIAGMADGDSLEMIEFSSRPRPYNKQPVHIEARTRADALAWVDALRAGGGTAMHTAVTAALAPIRPEAMRQVILMTDGYIGFEAEVIGRIRNGLPRGSRIHTVGVGSSVNRTLTSGVARAGGGHECIVGINEDANGPANALLAWTGHPVWADVSVSGTAVQRVAPAATPDLLANNPARVAVALHANGGTLTVRALTAAGETTHTITVPPLHEGQGRRVVATRYAREAVEDLEMARTTGLQVDAEVEALGLTHRIATRLTSWIAETLHATVDPSDPTRHEVIPVMLPHGVSAEGIGLRPASAPLHHVAPPPPALARRPSDSAVWGEPTRRSRRKKEATSEADEPLLRGVANEPYQEDRYQEDRYQEDRYQEAGRITAAPASGSARGAPEGHKAPTTPGQTAPARTMRCRVLLHRLGKLVITVEVDGDLDWVPGTTAQLALPDGSTVIVPIGIGTTRQMRLTAGQKVRIVMSWNGATPVTLYLGGLQLTVTA